MLSSVFDGATCFSSTSLRSSEKVNVGAALVQMPWTVTLPCEEMGEDGQR